MNMTTKALMDIVDDENFREAESDFSGRKLDAKAVGGIRKL